MKVQTGSFGYIKKKRNAYIQKILLFTVVGIGIFVLGLALSKWNRANIFTILAVLMVLPGAKSVTALILFLKYEPAKEEEYEKVYDTLKKSLDNPSSLEQVKQTTTVAEKKVTLLSDVIFTSSEKVMHLEQMILTEHAIYGMAGRKDQELKEIASYLSQIMKEHNVHIKVKVVDRFDQFLKLAEAVSTSVTETDYNEKVVKTMEIYIVE